MSFEKNKYEVVKKAISKELASFCYAYFLNKRQVTGHLQKQGTYLLMTSLGALGKIHKYQILTLTTETSLWKL